MKGLILQNDFRQINFCTSPKKLPLSISRTERVMLLNDVFDEIRNSVPMIDVAKFYGLQVSRSGMACCPFHDDKSPSLKIYPDHFYCFGCGETGDGVGFVAKAFGMTQLQAAEKLSYDFGLNLFDGSIATPITIKANPKAE